MARPKHSASRPGAKPTGISKSKSKSKSKAPHPSSTSKAKGKSHIQPQHATPTIPFNPDDRILLIGEGDLSFARSLIDSHACQNVIATVYEASRAEIAEKYPQAEENITAIEAGGGTIRYGVDATKLGPAWRESRGKVDRIIFNFPHVGGKSTDVNRQVRYNQELLVSFFKNALMALAPSTSMVRESASSRRMEGEEGEGKTSSVVVTLFEAEPYTLWNVRDLGRHAGLAVERSFRFQAEAYPGYKHARTLGVVKGKDGREGGWRGEERSARSYVFVRKGQESAAQVVAKKRKTESSDGESESDGEDAKEKEKHDDWTPGGIGENAIHPSRRGNVAKAQQV